MPGVLVCPTCGKKLAIPDRLAGNRMMCTKCGEIIPVPAHLARKKEDEELAAPYPTEAPPWAVITFLKDFYAGVKTPSGMGIAATALGLASVSIICIPGVGHAAPYLSGTGLLLGIFSLALSLYRHEKNLTFPLLGTIACGVALVLYLLGQSAG